MNYSKDLKVVLLAVGLILAWWAAVKLYRLAAWGLGEILSLGKREGKDRKSVRIAGRRPSGASA